MMEDAVEHGGDRGYDDGWHRAANQLPLRLLAAQRGEQPKIDKDLNCFRRAIRRRLRDNVRWRSQGLRDLAQGREQISDGTTNARQHVSWEQSLTWRCLP